MWPFKKQQESPRMACVAAFVRDIIRRHPEKWYMELAFNDEQVSVWYWLEDIPTTLAVLPSLRKPYFRCIRWEDIKRLSPRSLNEFIESELFRRAR